ncbi:MAG: hypothetical protein ABT940_03655 [Alphaproteobacteria bacterium]
MPEVKWVDRNDLYESDIYSDLTPKLLQPMVPVLTLDQIEAWLKGERLTLSQCTNSQQAIGRSSTIDDLLAQVQAWREGGTGAGVARGWEMTESMVETICITIVVVAFFWMLTK